MKQEAFLGALRQGQLTILIEDGERITYRGWLEPGFAAPLLAVVPAVEPPGATARGRLQHEYDLADELDSAWALRPRALASDGRRTVLLLEDPGSVPLESLIGAPMELGRFLRLAVGTAAALAKVHQRGLVHRDVKPSNIMVQGDGEDVRFTGFGIASRLARERRSLEPPESIEGTLAYMAPEQTGRMNRSIDSRSDLYSLGITLYQTLSGSLPFSASEPMEWIYCHVARNPPALDERIARLPSVVSAIVMKLLAKTAEERYQTAAGLEHDLRRCLTQWESDPHIEAFPLGERDTPDRLLVPEKPYGRESEVATLLASFERVAASGVPELILVSGNAGIGKSTLVNELHKALVPSHGLFAAGKFERYRSDVPYATLAQALQGLVRSLLAKSDAELGAWRKVISQALGPNGALVCDMVPELRHIVGDPPPAVQLSPQDAQARVQLVLRRFIGAFAGPDRPLVLFLDDLQWLDAATLGLVGDLATHRDVGHLLVIGAYRDDEVDATHPLMRELQAMRRSGAVAHSIALGPLRAEHIERLVADALHSEAERAAPLAELVREKTGGNPFFAVQFLQALVEDNLLRFDHQAACWSWDLARIRARRYTDNVIDLMVARLHRLPGETFHLLQQLACLGSHANTKALCLAYQIPEREAHARLLPAVRLGLLARLDGSYAFADDRIQEAAYTLISEDARAATHLRLGRVLLANVAAEQRQERIFDIVTQFNRGAGLIEHRDERDELARLNLAAARCARASSAYASALVYLAAGATLLGEDGWERHEGLAFELELCRAECEFLTGDPARAEQRLSRLSQRAVRSADRAAVACLRINLQTTLDGSEHSVRIGLEFLHSVGITWSAHPPADDVRSEFDQMWRRLSGRPIADLEELPHMSDPGRRATMDVLTTLLPPALFTDENLLGLVVARMANLSIDHGNCDGSCLAYIWLGLLLGPRFGDYRAALEFGQLGFDLAGRSGTDRFRARVYLDFSHVVNPWLQHARSGPALVRRAQEAASAVGDVNFAAYSSCNLVSALLAAGEPLDVVQQEAERQLAFARSLRFGLIVDIISGQLRLILTLRGTRESEATANRPTFDPQALECRLDKDAGMRVAIGWYWVRKLQGAVIAGDTPSAVQAAAKVEPYLWTMPSHLEVAEFHFYAALARAAFHDGARPEERAALIDSVRAHHVQLTTWEQNCPANFEARAALVAGEVARLEGRELDAERLYEWAIHAASTNGFVHDEAIANEIAANFYAARGFERIERAYRVEARRCYERWGAIGKVRQLDDRYPQTGPAATLTGQASSIVAPVEGLELATLLKVSQTLAGERVLERLLDTLMRTAVEQAGAQRGVLMLVRRNELTVEAEATTGGDTIAVRLRDVGFVEGPLPRSIIDYVVRTGESVILDNASAEEPFKTDHYVRVRHARSILCLPLSYRANLVAVLFLENNLAPGVFTPARGAVLKLLTSLAAISLEHARLDLERNAQVWFLESMDRINRAIQSTNDFGRMSSDVLAEVLAIFGCDRAWLVYPCDPAAPTWRPVMEQTRPEFPGAFVLGRDIPVDTEVARTFQQALDAPGSLQFGPAPDPPVPPALAQRFGIQSFIAMAVRTKLDRPYLFGLHQCSSARCWSTSERRLFEEIGHRLADSLTSLLIFRSLRDSEGRLDEAQRIAHVGYWEYDIGTGYVALSDEACRIHSLEQRELTDWRERLRELVHFEDRAGVMQAFAATVESGAAFDVECRLLRPNGELRVVQKRAHVTRDECGRPLRVFGMVQDITELRRAETERERLEERLRRAEKMEAIGTLAGGIAHDFNNVLAGIFAYGEMLFEETPEGSPHRRYVRNVLAAATRGRELVDQILAFSRSQRGRRAPVDLATVVAEVLELIRGSLPPAIRLEASTPGLPLVVIGDATRLHEVVMNLCRNAIQAMSAGGTLRVMLETTEVCAERALSHGTLAPGRYVCLTIEDSGGGMDEATLSRIFEPFFTTKGIGQGTGLGLALVYAIVTDKGGAIDVKSAPKQGSVFTIYLPHSEAALAAADAAATPPPRGHGEQVLLVDDDAPVLAGTAEVLLRLGYLPTSFSDSRAALAAFEAAPGRFDAVITDEAMVGLTGTELATALRRHRPDLPIVLLSGFHGPLLTQQAIAAGVSEVLTKPLQSREMATILARLLHRRA